MNQHTLHTGLAQLLEISGVKSLYPEVVYFSAYNSGEQDVLSLEQLVKFRLSNPQTPVLFFSFLPKEKLQSVDEFGVLDIESTAFIQLPCSKEALVQATKGYSENSKPISTDSWKSFSESACKSLIQNRITVLMHGQKFVIGNQALNPLRMNCVGLISMPELEEKIIPFIQNSIETFNQFLEVPEIAELLQWCLIGKHSTDLYLQNAFSFARSLNELSENSILTDINKTISLIDKINDLLEQLNLQ